MNSQKVQIKPLRLEILLHFLLWTTVLMYPYIKFMQLEGGYPESFLHELNSLFFLMVPSYTLYLWFLPKLNAQRWRMFPVLMLVFMAAMVGYEYTDSLFHPGVFEPFTLKRMISAVVKYLPFVMFFIALHVFKGMLRQREQLRRIKEEKHSAELSALKAQVTPHFLFNSLNGLYADALKVDPSLAEGILQLSNNTRYFLKEGQQDRVNLQQEIDHLQNYISLQQQRLADKVKVQLENRVENPNLGIAPLLIIPIVENAFKYTSMLRGNGHVISILISAGGHGFKLVCRNPYDGDSVAQNEWTSSGIGLRNVSKRLKLLYPDSHQLEIDRQGYRFSVSLKIDL